MIGKTVSHYQITEKLGGGGMGVVYRARDTHLDRDVALKFLPAHLSTDGEARERFIQEAKAASALDHPNICTIHDVDVSDEGELFIAMTFYAGATLKKKLAEGALPRQQALDIASQVAAGLSAAHKRGIVHRDIKPANLFVSTEGRVVILDFGLAKLAGAADITRSGSTLGTASYMSPEQTRSETVDHRTDIWSLGVVLYEMLSGQRPFEGAYEQAISYAIVNEPVEPPPGLSDDVQKILRRALAKDASDRYDSASRMETDLRRLLTPQPNAAQGANPAVNRSTRWYAALGAVVILALAFVIWRQLGQDRAVSTPGDLPSVAVLPLRTFAAEPGQDYFADAMTEALITNLSKIEGLSVRSRQSVMRYAESEDPIPGISEQLRVKYLLEGSVFWGGERLRVDAQLIEGSTDTHIWSNQYEAEVSEVLRVQRDIALAIAQEIGAALTVGDEQRMPTAQNVDPDAYRLLLRGRAILWRGHGPQRELAQEAKPFFEQAVERDSSFAEAWAALANAQALIANYRVEPLETAGPLASRYLNRALELSPTLSEPYLTKSLLAQLNGDWTRAEEALRQAISLAPGNSSHYGELCLYQLRTGRVNEALEAARKALELDPVSGYSHQVMTQAHYYARDFDEAIEWGQTWLESGGYRDMPLWYITRSYLDGGRSEQAIRVAEEAVAADSTEVSLFRLSYLRTLTGGREDHMELLAWCEEQGWTPCAAHLNILLGHRDRALDHLEEMYRDRRGTTTYIAVEPWWDPLRSEPRFQAIMRQLGLEPES